MHPVSRGTVAREFRVIFESTGQPKSFSSNENSPFTEAALSKRLVRPLTAKQATSVSSSPPEPTSSPVIDFFLAKNFAFGRNKGLFRQNLSKFENEKAFSLTERRLVVAKRSIVAGNRSCCRNPKVESEKGPISTFPSLQVHQLIRVKSGGVDFAFL